VSATLAPGRLGTDEEVEFIKSALDNTMIFHQFDAQVRIARVETYS
jgi:hypothetical protein